MMLPKFGRGIAKILPSYCQNLADRLQPLADWCGLLVLQY